MHSLDKTYLSGNLIHYHGITPNQVRHYLGEIVIFENSLTAIGGQKSNEVEMLQNNSIWNDSRFEPLPETVYSFSSLALDNFIFIFGE